MKNQAAFKSNSFISLLFPTDIFSSKEFKVTHTHTANYKYQIIVVENDIPRTIKQLMQLYYDEIFRLDLESINASVKQTYLKNLSILKHSYNRLFALADLPTEVRQLENPTHYYFCLWVAWHAYQNEKYSIMTRYLSQSRQYTDLAPIEVIDNWIGFLSGKQLPPTNKLISSSKFSQIPEWQKLIETTLTIESPKVSVIIPSYNCAQYLPQAIESVINQTYTAYEIIVIDDGSTDNTKKVIEPYLEKIRYVYQDNQGAAEARNHGLYLARGELIAFLDADDIFLSHKLKEQVAVFEAQPHIGIVNSGFRIIKDNDDVVMDIEHWHELPDLTPEIWLLHKPVLPSAMMFRREWFDRVGGFEQRFFPCEDMEITFRMVIKGCQSTWLPSVTVCYRRHERSATSFNQSNILRQAKSAEEMQNYFFARTDLPESIRALENKFRFYNFSWLAWRCYESGLIEKMAEYLEKSQNYAPFSWVEIIASWINTFNNCAKIFACDFDAYALSNLEEWQQVIANLKVSPLLNNYKQEVTKFQQLFAYQPNNSEISLYGKTYYQLGERLLKQRDVEQAIILFRKTIELVPQNALYHNALGNALKDRYDLEPAISAYKRAVRLQPNCQVFQQNLDEVLRLQNRWKELTNYCRQVTKNNNAINNNTSREKPLKMLMIFPFPCYPPQKGGAAIRMFEQLKYFGSRHHLTVVSIIFSEEDYVVEEQLASYCDRAFMVKLGVPMSPYKEERQQQLYFFQVWNMWKTLQQLSQIDFDVVFFDFIISTTYYPLFADRFAILNEHNIESKLLQRCSAIDGAEMVSSLAKEADDVKPFVNSEREAQLLAEYENQTWYKFPVRSVVSQEDKQELDSRCPTGKTLIVKNGIDTKNILPVDNSNSSKMLFMGTISYYPNIDAILYFVEAILPEIRKHNNDNFFCIAGRKPPSNIQALTKSDSSIEVIANPEDMSEVARQCQMTVVPLRLGGGTRIKILHSMAMGLPVVSTSVGSEGLEVIDGVHLLIRDNPQEFAEAVLEINSNPELREKLRTNGRKIVKEKYDWENIFAKYERQIWQLKYKFGN